MADYITAKLPNRVIVVTRDCDRMITVRRRDPVTGNPVDWDAKVSAVLQMLITKYPDAAFGPFNGKNGRAGAVYFRAYQ